MYRSQFQYTPKDVECEYCQNYERKNPCLLCECTCLDERIEASVLDLSEFVRDCFAPLYGTTASRTDAAAVRRKKISFFPV